MSYNIQAKEFYKMLFEIDKANLGKKFKEYRKNKKLTQFELSELIGLNEKQISRIEAGLNYPTYLTFVKLIEVLDIDIMEFVEETPITINPIQNEIINLIKHSNDTELKIFLNILKPLKKELKYLQK